MSAFNWSSAKFSSGSNNKEKLSDVVDTVEYPKKEYGAYRFVGAPRSTAMHWLTSKAKPKEGQKGEGKPVSFPVVCLGFDPESMEVDAAKCPYCTILEHAPRIEVRQNVIDRNEQENEPRKKKPFAKSETRTVEWNGGRHRVKAGKGKGGWTPNRVLNATPLIGNAVKEIASLNKHKVKGERKIFGPDHTRFGFDVMIKYNPEAKTPAQMYIVQKGEITPLTEEEKLLLVWDIPVHKAEEFKEAEKQAKRLKQYLCDRNGNLTFPEAAAEAKGEGKKKKKNQYKDEFDENEDVEDDEDEAPKKKKKRSTTDWDEDDDDGEAPFDTDDEPVKKKKKKVTSSSSSRPKIKVKTKVRRSMQAHKVKPKLKLRKFRSSYNA